MRDRFFARKGADMVSADTKTVIARAKQIYAEHLRAVLEPQHLNRFVPIEPESGEYFLGDTFDEAVKAARTKHPSRLSHTIRIGQRAAFHMGGHAAVNGSVDERLRALLRVPVSASHDRERMEKSKRRVRTRPILFFLPFFLLGLKAGWHPFPR